MRRWADTAMTDSAGHAAAHPVLAHGMERYVGLLRDQPAAAHIETTRLLGDLSAHRFSQGFAPRVQRHDSYIAVPGREIPLRIFDPGGDGARPAICYFHGGGFAFGSVESFDIVGAALAQATGAVVVSVQYRRLPETDYAGAQADCDEAFAWLARLAPALSVDRTRLALAGDSAGALLALACAVNACAAGSAAPICLLLFYATLAMNAENPVYLASCDPLLTVERVRGYIKLFRDCGGLESHPAPIDREDLAGLPPTHIVAAEFDPLCAEAIGFAARLDDAGVPVSLHVAQGMIHGFLRAVGVSAAARAEVAHAADALRPLLWPAHGDKKPKRATM